MTVRSAVSGHSISRLSLLSATNSPAILQLEATRSSWLDRPEMPDRLSSRLPKSPIPPRLDVLLARESDQAVILRRGPSKTTHLIAWSTSTDQFTPGQWLKARVYERRCDLSRPMDRS